MAAKTQNFKNHIRLVPGYHYLTYGVILLVLIAGGLIALKGSHPFLGAVIMLIGTALGLVGFYTRQFALRAQDRAIRAEENLRYFILTGKRFSNDLRLGQIIALRFASDEELPSLALRAENEKLSPKEIKKAIQQWRGDYHRV